jgi:chromosome segregation ATPase
MAIEERVSMLEQGLASMQTDFVTYLAENNQRLAILNRVISSQELRGREIDHNLTILLGVATGQEHAIKTMQSDLSSLRADVSSLQIDMASVQVDLSKVQAAQGKMQADLGSLRTDLSKVQADLGSMQTAQGKMQVDLDSIKERMEHLESHFDKRFDAIMVALTSRPPTPPEQ